jgi:hypothetical protein
MPFGWLVNETIAGLMKIAQFRYNLKIACLGILLFLSQKIWDSRLYVRRGDPTDPPIPSGIVVG